MASQQSVVQNNGHLVLPKEAEDVRQVSWGHGQAVADAFQEDQLGAPWVVGSQQFRMAIRVEHGTVSSLPIQKWASQTVEGLAADEVVTSAEPEGFDDVADDGHAAVGQAAGPQSRIQVPAFHEALGVEVAGRVAVALVGAAAVLESGDQARASVEGLGHRLEQIRVILCEPGFEGAEFGFHLVVPRERVLQKH